MSADGWPPSGRHPGWPAKLGPVRVTAGSVSLRPLRRSDGDRWQQIRIRDQAQISPWDATSSVPWADRHNRAQWHSHRSLLMAAARRGEVLPFVIVVGGQFVGQITIGGVQRGALRSAWVGYWVDSAVGGGGVATAALALTVGHALGPVGLHRVEATIAPENRASQAVVAHLGFRQEGYLQRYLDIDGAWRDHLLFAMTKEELPGGTTELLGRWPKPGAVGPPGRFTGSLPARSRIVRRPAHLPRPVADDDHRWRVLTGLATLGR